MCHCERGCGGCRGLLCTCGQERRGLTIGAEDQARFAACPGCEAIRTAGWDCSSCGTYVPRPGEIQRSAPSLAGRCFCGCQDADDAPRREPLAPGSRPASWEKAMSRVRRTWEPGCSDVS